MQSLEQNLYRAELHIPLKIKFCLFLTFNEEGLCQNK